LRGPVAGLRERDVTPDALLAGGGAALAVLGTWTSWHTGVQPAWVNGLLVVAGGLALGAARRSPAAVFLVECSLLLAADRFLPMATGTALVLVLASVAVFAMRVASWVWITLVYLAAYGLSVSVAGTPPAAVLLVLMLIPVSIGCHLRLRQAVARVAGLRARQAEYLAVARLRADELASREHIAREVHDIVAHHVGAMVLRAGAARYAAGDDPATRTLSDIRDSGHQALQDLRGLLEELREPGPRPPTGSGGE
jgi:signal transduction histidine kinase